MSHSRFVNYLISSGISLSAQPFYFIRHLSIPYHQLRYQGKINVKYNISDNIDFKSEEANSFFLNKLKKSKVFLEFGSGSSTLLANKLNIKTISVESDKSFFNFLKNKVHSKYYLEDLGIVYFFSTPVFSWVRRFYLNQKAVAYASNVLKKLSKEKIFPDLILVDGRYRVLCCLYIFLFIQFYNLKNIDLILDDYKYRYEYHILENIFDIHMIGRFGILKAKSGNFDIVKLIKQYQYDPR